MNKRIIFSIVFICMVVATFGQTVVWQMRPSDYSQIERIGNNMFKVTRNGKIGIINSDGSLVAPVINDNVSDLYEHKALITCNDGHGERITGCLNDKGDYFGYSTKYYALNGQKFFSDGLLSVADENGKLGYIDERGNQVVGFEGKFSRIKPFTEGYAAVKKGKKYVLIDKEGDEMRFVYDKGVGAAIVGCTNVYEGKAYVYDEYSGSDRSYFVYDAVGKRPLVKTKRIKDTSMDYLYCYQAISGRTKQVPYEKMKPYIGVKGLTPTYFNGAYGYESNGHIIVPNQFTSALQFEDGMAIVGLNGQTGILRFVEGAGFGMSVEKPRYDFYLGNSVSCSFVLSIPSIWNGKELDVVVKDADGSTITTTNKADTYFFSVKPAISGVMNYSVIVSSEGLKLYEGMAEYSFHKRERCATCGKDKTQCEYHGNHQGKKTTEGSKQKEDRCPTCKLKISECKYQGVH